jgi:hypothetical protein
VLNGGGIVGRRRVIEKAQDALTSSIRRIEKNFAIASIPVQRFQETEVAPIFYVTVAIARSLVEIDNDFIKVVCRIDFTVNPADYLFVGAGDGEFKRASERFPSFDSHTADHGYFPSMPGRKFLARPERHDRAVAARFVAVKLFARRDRY